MLQKNYRLPASTRLNHPQTYVTSFFVVKIALNNHTHSRFGFVVSKAVDKRATARNRMRRMARSCVEELLPKVSAGHDMLFFLKRDILAKKRADLYNEVHTLFKEKHLLI